MYLIHMKKSHTLHHWTVDSSYKCWNDFAKIGTVELEETVQQKSSKVILENQCYAANNWFVLAEDLVVF